MRPPLARTIYPASLLLEGKPCLIVGGGKVAVRKAGGLLEAGASVTVISPEMDERLAELVRQKRVQYVARPFSRSTAMCWRPAVPGGSGAARWMATGWMVISLPRLPFVRDRFRSRYRLAGRAAAVRA